MPSLAGRLFRAGAELLAATLVTIGFFGVFLFVLARVFPMGPGLEELATEIQNARTAQARRGALASQGGTGTSGATAPAILASLSILRPDVRSKPADAITWNPARTGQAMQDRDGVQTGEQGRALLAFGMGNDLVLERNSLVILSGGPQAERDQAGSVVVLEGDLWARFSDAGKAAPRVTIGNARLAPGSGEGSGGASEFRVRVDRERAGTITVLKGALDLRSDAGAVRIGPRQFGRISASGAVTAPASLPAEPLALGPDEAASFEYRDVPPRITFRWSEVPRAAQYRLVVSRDRSEKERVVDESLGATSVTWGRLKEGRYFWRVSALSGDVEGAPSPWRKLTVARSAEPPKLTVTALPKTVDGSSVRLRGRVDRAATVYVTGVKVMTVAEGSFEFECALKPGANVIVVEAVDAMGNTTYWSQIVNARFQGME